MVSTLFRDPQAQSSALAVLGTLQPRAFGSLNRVETLDSSSNYYLVSFKCTSLSLTRTTCKGMITHVAMMGHPLLESW